MICIVYMKDPPECCITVGVRIIQCRKEDQSGSSLVVVLRRPLQVGGQSLPNGGGVSPSALTAERSRRRNRDCFMLECRSQN